MKYVLITGGTSGIGYELAKIFAKEKYGLIIVSANEKKLKIAKELLEKEYNSKVITYCIDLGKIGAALEVYKKVKEDKLNIFILVNNAGIGLVGSTEKIDLEQDENMMTLNVINLVSLCKLFIKDMLNQREGKILNVSSIGAFQPGPYTSTYFASKAFVSSYSRAIRFENNNKNIQISTLYPGATKSEFFDREGMKTPKNSMSSKEVALIAYKGLMKNKEIIIPGIKNRIMILLPMKLRMLAVARTKNKI